MRILHCCLAAFYIDDAGYQENILPKMHKLQGHDVSIIASTETYIDNKKLGYVAPRQYLSSDEIPVTRLGYSRWLPHALAKKVRSYPGLTSALEQANPDIIFLHNCQFWDTHKIINFVREHPNVKVYVDGHSDFINSANTWVSKNVLHGLLYKRCTKVLEPYVQKFWGVLPARVDFFSQMYDVAPEKTDLLVLGADDTLINWKSKDQVRKAFRNEHGIGQNDFVIISGGKIDRRKNFPSLLKAIAKLNRDDIKLVIFGTPNDDMKVEFEALAAHPNIVSLGWVKSTGVYDLFLASDLAVFPGTHSVLWEQAVGTGLPAIFRRWSGIEHVDVGGNCIFLDQGTEDEIATSIESLVDSKSKLESMRNVAIERGIPEFSFSMIAKRAIEQ